MPVTGTVEVTGESEEGRRKGRDVPLGRFADAMFAGKAFGPLVAPVSRREWERRVGESKREAREGYHLWRGRGHDKGRGVSGKLRQGRLGIGWEAGRAFALEGR